MNTDEGISGTPENYALLTNLFVFEDPTHSLQSGYVHILPKLQVKDFDNVKKS